MLVGHLVENSEDDYYNEACRDCSGRMRVGDVAMVFDRGRAVFADRDLIWHWHCIEAALASAPLDKDRLAGEVARIRATGLRRIRQALA